MRPKAESMTSQKSRANNLTVLVEFLIKFTSNSGFQLFLDVLLNFAPFKKIAQIELSFKIEVVCVRISFFKKLYNVNVLRLVFSEI